MKCKHVWERTKFIGDPFTSRWNCKVTKKCSKCNSNRDRYASQEEIDLEIADQLCATCGFKKKDHVHNGVDIGCVGLLGETVRGLQDQLRVLENWRNS